MNTNFKVIGLTRLEIKPKSTSPRRTLLPLGHLSCELLFLLYFSYVVTFSITRNRTYGLGVLRQTLYPLKIGACCWWKLAERLRGGSRGCLWYRARNFENAARKKFRKKLERATLDWLKADKVTHCHHLPVIPLTHSWGTTPSPQSATQLK